MPAQREPVAFEGHWEQRGMIRVPVKPRDDYADLFDFGPEFTLTSEPVNTNIDHVPSHAGFNAHKRRGEEPCPECTAAERMYHHNRRQR